MNKEKNKGFTLIEIMVAVIIFAIISAISYRVISILVTTKEVATSSENKWGGVSLVISRIDNDWYRIIPLTIRDANGGILPAVYGQNKLNNAYDAQIELTVSGYIGDKVYGTMPPKRVGYRFFDGSLYMITWPVLNRVQNTYPQVDLLLTNIKKFEVSYLYPDLQWRDTWPQLGGDPSVLPKGIKLYIVLNSGEEITRKWAL